ncbi:MAG: type 1 glutamine amidotransferase [Spirochaetota bacterium]|nr:type 1 glutamine amidotransferase [Spirochaetota bacterium]
MIVCIQHVPFETPGYILDWAIVHQKDVAIVTAYTNHDFPVVDSVEMLVIMGGPMSVHDEREYPWLVTEKHFIEKVINKGKPVLGICLGAQLIADVLGARVYKNHTKEIGWFEVQRVQSENPFSKLLPDTFMAFHWHGETFDIPAGAIHIASTDVCANQAFAIDDRIVGLQFHLEITAQGVYDLVANCGAELKENGHIQSKDAIIAGISYCKHTHAMMDSLLEAFTMSYRT